MAGRAAIDGELAAAHVREPRIAVRSAAHRSARRGRRALLSCRRACDAASARARRPSSSKQRRRADHDHDPPLPDAAGDADAGREPGAGGAGEPVNPEMMLAAHDHAGAEKADAGKMPWITRLVASEIPHIAGQRQHHHHRGGKADQASVFRPIGLPCRSRSSPITPPASVATPRRSTISGQSSTAIPPAQPISAAVPSDRTRRSGASR